MGRDHIVIVGTGFAGLGMGIQLRRSGITDFTILEQADRVGGTWRDNTYPGAACDIESHLYSFSFEPNPGWSRAFAPQEEILAYLERCAEKYGLLPHIRFNTAAVAATFDEDTGQWTVETSNGESITARVLVSGTGGLSRPSYPDIPGLDSFEGKVFHSARWDHDYPLDGKRVAVIGTGASAIQIVPAIAPKVGRLQLFQRTPPWIIPKPDRAVRAIEHRLYRWLPFTQQLVRLKQFLIHELHTFGFVWEPRILKLASRLAQRHLRESVPDPALRAKLTPQYVMGCKRILLSNDYYPALTRENVEVVTDGIREITPRGVLTCDGTEREVDAIVLATGFQAAEAVSPYPVRGRDGRDLNEVWRNGAEAYLGTTVSGFPNLFLIVGPNTGLGSSSMVLMIESQIAYVLSAIETMRTRRLRSVDLRPDEQANFNQRLQQRLSRTVWNTGGCVSWYRTRDGRNTTLWPGLTSEFRLRTRRFEAALYECVEDGKEASPAQPAGLAPDRLTAS